MFKEGVNQASGMSHMKNKKPVRVIAIASGKGGVGKTNLSVNLGISFCKLGQKVALLDADMGLANVDILLGLHPNYNLTHVLSGEKSLDDIVVEGPSGLKVIPASSGVQHMAEMGTMEQAGIINAFSEFQEDIDLLLVDTAAGIHGGVVNFARACQEVIVVVCDEPTSLTDAYALIKLLNRDHGLNRFHVVTNMVESLQHGQALYQKLCKVTDQYLEVALYFTGAVPFDKTLRKSVQKQQAVVESSPNSQVSIAIKHLAKKINSWPVQRGAAGYLEFFVERLIQSSQMEESTG
ncbi:MAG: cobyrinic acid a,c-diamide synthase [Cycloclasticus sp.]|nr:cobyrinic acid a,c-diamide synthase [Cycloclasticus sp.]MBG95530.1 cobyrinic acid a,c-diamide synthase [Cycloclasticus sp.]HAI96353.1 cobyrinic acid a,c-diamide synthase [Methylococcaceae bacterium]|tara:strand:- start:1526 stop:2404 length:879 start_codon:yes stop_codon:yes gene_type:complete